MSANESVDVIKIINALRQLRHNIEVACDYSGQMAQIKLLLKNDKTGMVSTVLDFMTHSATVPLSIESDDDKLNKFFRDWQKTLLNKDLGIDIPRGLRELSTEYYRERWTSSWPALVIQWGEVGTGKEKFTIPTRMYFVDGCAINVESDSDNLLNRKYFLGKDKKVPLSNTANRSVIIRKPFNAWYEKYPTPYLVKHGIMFNALLKEAIINKQADVIQQIIPYLLLLKAGTDKLAELGMMADETDLKALKEEILRAKNEHDNTGELGKLFATLNYDVNLEHFIPDLSKILDEKITRACDRNIAAGFGLIELHALGQTREEAVLNPKLLVEEIKDAVGDWASMLEEVMQQTIERNKDRHPNLPDSISVLPGRLKTFMTDAMRDMLRSMADRGVISYQTEIEDIVEGSYEIEKKRIKKEEKDGSRELFAPKPNQVVLSTNTPSAPTDNIPDDKKPGSPESKNFTNATLENIDQLPVDIKGALPVPAQLIFFKAFNEGIKLGSAKEAVMEIAWSTVKRTYKQVPGKPKWVKKD